MKNAKCLFIGGTRDGQWLEVDKVHVVFPKQSNESKSAMVSSVKTPETVPPLRDDVEEYVAHFFDMCPDHTMVVFKPPTMERDELVLRMMEHYKPDRQRGQPPELAAV